MLEYYWRKKMSEEAQIRGVQDLSLSVNGWLESIIFDHKWVADAKLQKRAKNRFFQKKSNFSQFVLAPECSTDSGEASTNQHKFRRTRFRAQIWILGPGGADVTELLLESLNQPVDRHYSIHKLYRSQSHLI